MAEINIAGTLHNTEEIQGDALHSHVVAKASEILDETKSKKQSEVNAEVDETLVSHESRLNAFTEGNFVTVESFSALPATGSVDTVYRVSSWDGTANSGQGAVDVTKYSEYAWENGAYKFLDVKTQIGEVFDISEYNNSTYADLEAALSGTNVPTAIRRGGMSVKYVRTSDNKYVQYRFLLSGSFTDAQFADTNNWVFYGNSMIVENPEYIDVKIDKDGRILWAIKTDGKIYWGAGVPQQVIDYVNEKIAELTEYDDIVTFLGNLIEGDKTLQQLLNEKVDKEEGKGLSTNDYTDADKELVRVNDIVENPEYIKAVVDSEGKLLAGRTPDGAAFENVGFSTPKISINGTVSENVEDPEGRLEVKLDADGKIISYRDAEGVLHENVGINAEELVLSSNGIKNMQEALGINFINTGLKKEEFCSLFKDAAGEVESFIFFSDPHYFTSYDKCEIKNGATNYLARIKDYFDNTPTDFVICGGDWLQAQKQSIAIKDLGWIDGFMNNLFPMKYYPVFGNHDNNYQGELDLTSNTSANDGALSNQQMVNLWFRKYGKMYYSFKGSNTKFYVLDTGIDWVTTMDSYKWEQVDWFANALLSNNDTHIVIALHIVQLSGTTFGNNVTPIADNIFKVAEAFNGRTSITLNENTYDFTNSQGTVHAAICGHTHYDATATINSIPVYCIKDAQDGDFDMLLFDYAASKLKSIRIGTGSNREMNII